MKVSKKLMAHLCEVAKAHSADEWEEVLKAVLAEIPEPSSSNALRFGYVSVHTGVDAWSNSYKNTRDAIVEALSGEEVSKKYLYQVLLKNLEAKYKNGKLLRIEPIIWKPQFGRIKVRPIYVDGGSMAITIEWEVK